MIVRVIALEELVHALEQKGPEAMQWAVIFYKWYCVGGVMVIRANHGRAIQLHICARRRPIIGGDKEIR